MSDDTGLTSQPDNRGGGARPTAGNQGRRRAPRPSRSGRRTLVVAVVALVAVFLAGLWAVGQVRDRFGPPDDYQGQGTGEATVRVAEGANGGQIAKELHENDVVASTEVFYRLLLNDERAHSIQPGTYRLRKKMSAEAALAALVDRANRVESRVTIPEGTRVDDIVELIAKNTDLRVEDLEAALADPASIGLPEAAQGNPEGYLFPETYFVEPDTTATQLLSTMVQQTVSVIEGLGIEQRSAELGYDTEQIMTIASILEWEVNNDEDFRKASRVIYNRLDADEALRMDSTVHYISGRRGDAYTTDAERDADSPYNTYKYPGLPPGPIGSPGKAAIEAALSPADGDWMYFVTDVKTGKTTFTTTYGEHQRACRDAGFEC